MAVCLLVPYRVNVVYVVKDTFYDIQYHPACGNNDHFLGLLGFFIRFAGITIIREVSTCLIIFFLHTYRQLS